MPKKGIAIAALGAVLILSALLLFLHNRQEDIRAGQEAESLVQRVEAEIREKAQTIPPAETTAETQPEEEVMETEPPEMPVTVLNGYGYIGYLEIPAQWLKLAVMSEWDYNRLRLSPCRQCGTTYGDDLVIAAHNYDSHFGRLKNLNPGDLVTFTDMDGVVNTYSVTEIDTVSPESVDAVLHSGHDLVLYTCTPGGRTRVTVFCDRAEPVQEETTAP